MRVTNNGSGYDLYLACSTMQALIQSTPLDFSCSCRTGNLNTADRTIFIIQLVPYPPQYSGLYLLYSILLRPTYMVH